MPKLTRNDKLSDSTRLLLEITTRLATGEARVDPDPRSILKGDLVVAATIGKGYPSIYQVGFVEAVLSEDHTKLRIRPVGMDFVSTIENERFLRVLGVPKLKLLEGPMHKFYLRAKDALEKYGTPRYALADVNFDYPSKRAILTIVPGDLFAGYDAQGLAYYDYRLNPQGGATVARPLYLRVHYNGNPFAKEIYEELVSVGYGTWTYERMPAPILHPAVL
jgi:hypothetical protein